MAEPRTYLVGYTNANLDGIQNYLLDTGQTEFLEDWKEGIASGLSEGECLISMFAKLCYKSLVTGKNENISKTRSIRENLKGVLASGHGSVFEHVSLNFLTTNCSRVFTHELVRHRVGTAFSQTSGRYCAIDESLDIIFPSEYMTTDVKTALGEFQRLVVEKARLLQNKLIPPGADFATKKKITSAIRRIAPNGQANEIGWSANLRTLRHLIELRTSRHAEWEIRLIFNQVADIVKDKWPMLLHGAETEVIDGFVEYRKLKV